MKNRNLLCVLLLALAAGAASAATYEDGLRLMREQKTAEAAAAFSEVVQREPRNVQALEKLATVQGWLNRFDDSIASWRRVVALAPRKPDGHVGLARVLYWKGERAESLRELDAALNLAPRDADALMLKGDVLMADRRPGEARAAYLQTQALSPNNAELQKKLANAVAPLPWRLDAGIIGDRYSSGRGSENESYVQLGYSFSPETTAYVHFDRMKNFGEVDLGLSAGGYFLPAKWLLLNAEYGVTPDTANFRAKSIAVLNSEFLLEGAVQPLLGVRYMHYNATVFSAGGNVTTITPGLRLLAAPAVIEARYGYSNNIDKSKTGVTQLRASFDLENCTPYVAFFTGREALPPLAKADIRVFVVGSVFNLSPNWGARVDLTHENRKNTYTHNALGVGLTYRF